MSAAVKSKSMPSFLRRFRELRNELLLLPLQLGLIDGVEQRAGMVELAHLQADIGRVEAHRLALDRGRCLLLEVTPGLERLVPIRILQVVERFGVPIGKLETVGG